MEHAEQKFFPEIGTPLYLHQYTGDSWVDECKDPYTVIGYQSGKMLVQSCTLIAPIYNGDRAELQGQRVFFYDTVAERIEPNPAGEVLELVWAPKRGRWQIDRYKTGYPQVANFGEYKHQPYRN